MREIDRCLNLEMLWGENPRGDIFFGKIREIPFSKCQSRFHPQPICNMLIKATESAFSFLRIFMPLPFFEIRIVLKAGSSKKICYESRRVPG